MIKNKYVLKTNEGPAGFQIFKERIFGAYHWASNPYQGQRDLEKVVQKKS